MALVALALPLAAQNTLRSDWASASSSRSITAAASDCSTPSACAWIVAPSTSQSAVTVQLSGTFTATLQFESSVDGATWAAISSGASTSATAAGLYYFNLNGAQFLWVRASSYTSGTVTVAMSAANGCSTCAFTNQANTFGKNVTIYDSTPSTGSTVLTAQAGRAERPRVRPEKQQWRYAGGYRSVRRDLRLEFPSRQRQSISVRARHEQRHVFDQRHRAYARRNWRHMELQGFVDIVREILDRRREAIRALGTGKLQNFIEDYFPHLWKDVQQARSTFENYGERPLEGSKAFLKKRVLDSFADGIALGFEPVSENPVELVLLKAREMDKYLMAYRILADLAGAGQLKYIRATQALPAGWVKIDDNVATVWTRPRTPARVRSRAITSPRNRRAAF